MKIPVAAAVIVALALPAAGPATAQAERGQKAPAPSPPPSPGKASPPATSGPASWNPQDGWAVWKALEPERSAQCETRDCPAWKGNLTPWSQDKAVWHGRFPVTKGSQDWINYAFKGCAQDKTGCTSVEISIDGFGSIFPADLARYRASKPACLVEGKDTLGFVTGLRLVVEAPLKKGVTLASLQAARSKVLGCQAALMAMKGE